MEIRNRSRSGENISIVSDSSDLISSQDSPLAKIRQQWGQIRSNFQVLLSPGDNQFKDLPKRVRLMVVSLGVPLLYAITKLFIIPQSNSVLIWGGIGALLALITYLGMYWGVKGHVRKDSYYSVLPLPSLLVFSNVMFLSTTFIGEINRLYLWGLFAAAIAIFMIFLYMVTLAVNVLNVTLFYTIPLSRLGETVAYIASIVTLFLLSVATADMIIPMIILGSWLKLAIAFFCYFCVILALVNSVCRYFIPYKRGFITFTLGVTIVFFITFAVFALMLPYSWLAGVMLSLVGYILLGYIIHKEQNTYKTPIIVEFLVLLAIAFLVLILA